MTDTRSSSETASAIRWQRVNDEPFEYAIQQGPHGDEFVKLLDGTCLRRVLGVAQAAPDPSLQKMQISTRNAMIEECARVADRWGDGEATMAAAEIRMLKTSPVSSTPAQQPPSPPTALHWLGDRENADATRHAMDMTGCVMYFQQQSDCLKFMRWVEALCTCGGRPGQSADQHDISCPSSVPSTSRGTEA